VAFMDMLRNLDNPGITSTSKWAEVAPRVADDERCIAVPEPARELMFETYVEAVAKLEKARISKAEEAFQVRSRLRLVVVLLKDPDLLGAFCMCACKSQL
jgi:FF domain